MHEMEEKVRSDGGLVKKKKNSSGCLIIKKKGHGIDGAGSSGSRKVFESNKERKRSRLVLSESSEESIEPIRRKVDKFRNGSVVYRNDGGEDGKFGGNDEIESESERKRRLDVFEFDEYDGIDGKRMKKDCFQDKFKLKGREREFGTGCSSKHVMIEKRKKSYFDSNKSSSSGGRKEVADYSVKSRFDVEDDDDDDDDDEAHLPISSLRQKFQVPPDEPIRVQGRNGVLKVMVNKNKTTDLPHKLYARRLKVRDRKGSESENVIKKKNESVRPSFYSDSKRPEKEISIVRTEKSENKVQKSLSSRVKAVDSETEDSDKSLQGPKSVHDRSSSKGIKSEAKAPSAEKITSVRAKEVKVKRGSGTEKQLLREKIRHMLVTAGWTIDYRPRRNRDYLDAVYINPTGTAYWSIIKAYDALQKQLDEEEEDDDDDRKPSGDASPFTPLPEELLSKLTRQTQKKLEREMKMKRKDHGRSKKTKFAREESAEGTHSDQDDDKLSFFMKQNGKSSKGRSHETACVSGDDSSSKLRKGSTEKSSTANNSHVTQGNRSQKFGRCTLLIRNSDKGLNSESDGYIPYTGKRTLLSWLIDSGTVNLSEKVQYMNRKQTRVMLEGWVTRDGIHCGCCSKILTVSKFEIHAGSKLRQPFQNIFLESGVSLFQCQIDAWNKQEESECRGFQTVDIDGDDPNDDTCGLCGDGGDLICCDGCPSTFHQNCLDIQMLPAGDWHCPNCTCKFCGIADGISTQGNCTAVGALRTCSLCEKKYHESCSPEMDPLQGLNCASTSFCGHKCQELFDHLQKLLGVKHELKEGFSWSLVHRTDLNIDASHRGFPQRVESNSKLAVALSVMDECFLPIVDRRSGINLIHNVLYNCGSNFSRLNYSGFYTAILEKGDEIICAASIRIHGTQLAEMPFIGTRHIYRRQGMCRQLFCAIESALCSLKVEKLIIPAIAEHIHTWTVAFGFNPLEESDKQEMRSVNMLVFPGADMIQKLLVDSKTNEGNITVNSGTKSILIKEDHLLTPDLTKKIDVNSSAGHDLNCNTDTDMRNANEMDDKAAVLDSGLPAPAIPSNDNSCLNGSLDVPSDPELKVLSEEKTVHSRSVKKSTESSADMKSSPSCDSQNIQLEMDNHVLDSYVKSNSSEDGVVDDVHKANVKVAVSEPILDSSGETSTMNAAEVIDGDQNILSDSTDNGTEENVNQSNTEAQDLPVECNIQSSSEGYEDDASHVKAKVSCVGPILDSKGEISAQNSTEEKINESHDLDSVSSPHGAQVIPVEGNVQFFTSGDTDNTHEVNGKILAVEPDLDCHGDISAQKKDVNEDQAHASVSLPNGSDESTMPFNLNAASEVAPDEEVALIGGNICSSAEDHVGKDAQKANVANTSVEPVLTSSDETSVENETQEIIENVAVLTSDGCDGRNIQFESDQNQNAAIVTKNELHGSDGSTVQFESDQDQNTAIEMKTELHTDSKVPSDAMDCDKNI